MNARELFFVSTRRGRAIDALAGDGNRAAAFVTLQSLTTFPVASGVITLLWNVLQSVGDWADSRLVPFAGAVLVGGFLTIWSLTDPEARMTARDKGAAVFIGAVNILFLYAAAVGIDTSVDLGSNDASAALRFVAR